MFLLTARLLWYALERGKIVKNSKNTLLRHVNAHSEIAQNSSYGNTKRDQLLTLQPEVAGVSQIIDLKFHPAISLREPAVTGEMAFLPLSGPQVLGSMLHIEEMN